MKKLIYLIVLVGAFALVVAGCGLLTTAPSSEESELDSKAKPNCTTIQDGTLYASTGELLTTGYDEFGYNYQAHMYIGYYGNYQRPPEPVDWGYQLMMKWNNAWLSNKDCDNDGLLDRHFGYASYIGSGAWLTNHQSGSYKKDDCWTFTGDWVLELDFEGVQYAHDVTFTTEVPCESFSGTGGYPSGEIYTITSTVSGVVNTSVVPNEVLITITYVNPMAGSERYLDGTIAADGTMSGEWTSNVAPEHSGTWKSTMGTALCYWDYFVKIVAAPSDAYVDSGVWYAEDGTEIGEVIWGAFAVIQEVENDPCAGISGVQYHSPAGPGLGKWEY